MFSAKEFVEITLKADNRPRHGTIRYQNEVHLIVECKPEDISFMKIGAPVGLVQLVNDYLYQMDSTVIHSQGNCFAVTLNSPRVINQRKSQRISCQLKMYYKHADIMPQVADTDGRFCGEVHDMSLGGAKLYVCHNLPAQTPMEMEIQITEGSSICLRAEIVRCMPLSPLEASASKPLTYEAAVKFSRMERLDQVKLHRFLVEEGEKE